jgi:beta-lactamase family protein/uncharacterized protein DUF4145
MWTTTRERKTLNTLQTRFRIGSMNKMFTAVAILQLVQARKLRLDDPLEKYLTDYPDTELPWRTKYTLAKCPACNAPLLAMQSDLTGDGWNKPASVFPPRDREFDPSVPKDIARAFTEARTCFRAKAFIAATIMCRKTLEGICSMHGVKSPGPLKAQLKKLKEKGTMESRLFEWAEELRTTGSEAALGVGAIISPKDAHDTLEFTEAVIEHVFTTRDNFEG